MAQSKPSQLALLSRCRNIATHPQIFCLSKMIFRIMVVLGLVALCGAQDKSIQLEDGQRGLVVQQPGLQAAARVVRDINDIAHVKA